VGVEYPEKKVCISGAGQSEVGRPSARTALQLTIDACLSAIEAAGLTPADIDGLTTYPGRAGDGGGFSPVGAIAVNGRRMAARCCSGRRDRQWTGGDT
jgi:hypothetical protein